MINILIWLTWYWVLLLLKDKFNIKLILDFDLIKLNFILLSQKLSSNVNKFRVCLYL